MREEEREEEEREEGVDAGVPDCAGTCPGTVCPARALTGNRTRPSGSRSTSTVSHAGQAVPV